MFSGSNDEGFLYKLYTTCIESPEVVKCVNRDVRPFLKLVESDKNQADQLSSLFHYLVELIIMVHQDIHHFVVSNKSFENLSDEYDIDHFFTNPKKNKIDEGIKAEKIFYSTVQLEGKFIYQNIEKK